MYRYVLVCALWIGMWTSPTWGQEDLENGESNKVIIKGKEFTIYPPKKLRARGMEVRDVPRDQNAAWVYIDAINAMVDLPEDLQETFDGATAGEWPEGEAGDRLAAWLEQNRTSLDLIRRASVMDEYDMPFFRGDTDAIIAILLPNLSDTRQLAKTLSVEASHLMSQGDADAALECCLTTQRMAYQVGNGKTIIEGLVGNAVGGLAQQGMMRITESGEVSAEILKATIAEMEDLSSFFPSFERMVRAEMQWAESFIDDAIEIPGSFTMLSSGYGTVEGLFPPPAGWSRLAVRLKRLYLPDRTVKKHFKEHYEALINATKKHEDGTVGMVIDEATLFNKIPAWDILSRMMLPSLSRAHELSLRAESNHIRAFLTMAAVAYKTDQGEYPPTLSALVPAYVPSVPADPMTGYDFEYEATSGEKPVVKGLAMVTRENEAELRKKRRTPAILNPRASRWRRYVQSVCDRYELTDAQRASAEAILRDMEARAARYEQVHGAKLQRLIEAGQSAELARRTDPLDKMFKELRQRLVAIPNDKQRASAKRSEAKDSNKEN